MNSPVCQIGIKPMSFLPTHPTKDNSLDRVLFIQSLKYYHISSKLLLLMMADQTQEWYTLLKISREVEVLLRLSGFWCVCCWVYLNTQNLFMYSVVREWFLSFGNFRYTLLYLYWKMEDVGNCNKGEWQDCNNWISQVNTNIVVDISAGMRLVWLGITERVQVFPVLKDCAKGWK